MFTITIQKPTGEEAIAELMRVAEFYQKTGILAPESKPAKKPKPATEPAPASEPASAPAPTPPKAADPEEIRTQIRAALTPLMTTDKAAQARALVKQFGAGISAVPEDKLAELLAKAQEMTNE